MSEVYEKSGLYKRVEKIINENTELKAKLKTAEDALRLSMSIAGHPNPIEGCRIIIRNHKDALAKIKETDD